MLPPRHGGVLALLDAMPAAEVWLCVHCGLETAVSFGALWRGDLIGQRVDVEIRRLGRDVVPVGEGARREWLDALWRDVDSYVGARSSLACRDTDG